MVLVSGAGMRATATDDAPMLFAFPYGRNLRVVSHYGNWVEVTDPKSAATGWMKAPRCRRSLRRELPPRPRPYDDQQPRQRPRAGSAAAWRRLRRHDQPRARRPLVVLRIAAAATGPFTYV